MAHELFLARLWDADAELPTAGLHDVARSTMPPGDERWHVTDLEGGRFEIEFPDGQASVDPTHVAFRLQGMSPPLAVLMHALAKAADAAILNEGGGPHVLLVDPRHVELLDAELQKEEPVVCLTPEQLL